MFDLATGVNAFEKVSRLFLKPMDHERLLDVVEIAFQFIDKQI